MLRGLPTGAQATASAVCTLHLGDVQKGLNAAAQVHDGEHTDADLATERHK